MGMDQIQPFNASDNGMTSQNIVRGICMACRSLGWWEVGLGDSGFIGMRGERERQVAYECMTKSEALKLKEE